MKTLILFINNPYNRDNSELDTKLASEVFPKFGYEYRVYNQDVSKTDLTLILNNAVTYISTAIIPFDRLMVFVGAHGNSDYVYLQDESFMRVEEIVNQFLPHNCPALTDKQIMFFFQNCRKFSYTQSPSRNAHIEDLVQSTGNMLIAFSAQVGSVSYRTENGSVFFQVLLKLIDTTCISLKDFLKRLVDMVREEAIRLHLTQIPEIFNSISEYSSSSQVVLSTLSPPVSNYSSCFTCYHCNENHHPIESCPQRAPVSSLYPPVSNRYNLHPRFPSIESCPLRAPVSSLYPPVSNRYNLHPRFPTIESCPLRAPVSSLYPPVSNRYNLHPRFPTIESCPLRAPVSSLYPPASNRYNLHPRFPTIESCPLRAPVSSLYPPVSNRYNLHPRFPTIESCPLRAPVSSLYPPVSNRYNLHPRFPTIESCPLRAPVSSLYPPVSNRYNLHPSFPTIESCPLRAPVSSLYPPVSNRYNHHPRFPTIESCPLRAPVSSLYPPASNKYNLHPSTSIGSCLHANKPF